MATVVQSARSTLEKALDPFIGQDPLAQSCRLIRISRFAEFRQTDRRTIEREVASGELPTPIKVGGRVYFSEDDILDWWAAKSTRPCRRTTKKAAR